MELYVLFTNSAMFNINNMLFFSTIGLITLCILAYRYFTSNSLSSDESSDDAYSNEIHSSINGLYDEEEASEKHQKHIVLLIDYMMKKSTIKSIKSIN